MVHDPDEGIAFPDPFHYTEKAKLLFISWSPPGGSDARRLGTFFHNPKAGDGLRNALFEVTDNVQLTRKSVLQTNEQKLTEFYRNGLYLVPTVFRRCSQGDKDKHPPADLVEHSANTHVHAVLEELVNRQASVNVFLLGSVPIRAFIKLFATQRDGQRLRNTFRNNGVTDCREMTTLEPLHFKFGQSGEVRAWASTWPKPWYKERTKEDLRHFLKWESQHKR